MIEILLKIDEFLFIVINRQWQNVFFDWLLPLWRDKYFWIPAYLLLLLFLWAKVGKKSLTLLLFLGLTVGLSDLTSSFLIKESVQRIRPCNDPVFMKKVFLRAPCGSGYSFTSSHAANHFAMAVFLFFTIGQLIGKWRFLLIFWAISIGLAQVYVGVHYPLDVLGGFLIGGVLGIGFYIIFKTWVTKST